MRLVAEDRTTMEIGVIADTEQHDRLEDLFNEVVNLPSEKREAFLGSIDEENNEIGDQVRRLLAAHERGCSIIDGGAITVQERNAEEITVAPEITLEPSAFLGNHRIIRQIGRGGMGRVYLAHDTKLFRQVAIKVLPPEVSSDPERIRRFRREAHIISGLNHPCIITIFEVGESDGLDYLVTEFVEGSTLRNLASQRPMDAAKVVKIVLQVAEALGAAHRAGVVHRDIKPENIMLRDDGYVKVLDFGLATVDLQKQPTIVQEYSTYTTQHSIPRGIGGTPSYMSPEQSEGEFVDARSDIFSLGIVTYELLTGTLPFKGSNVLEIREAFMSDTPVPIAELRPELPPLLSNIVTRMLQKEPGRRFQKSAELIDELKLVEALLNAENRTPFLPTVSEPATTPLPNPTPKPLDQEIYQGFPNAVHATMRFVRARRTEIVLFVAAALIATYVYTLLKTPGVDSLAILPLENRTGEQSLDVLSEGLTEGLIGSLSQIKGMKKVISHSSVRRYQDTNKDAKTITSELDVGALVVSNIIRKSGHIIWTIELIDPNGRRIWGDQHERASEKENFSELPGEVALEISKALRITPSGQLAGQGRLRGTASAEAYEAYNVGRSVMDKRRQEEQGLLLAISRFQYAIDKDPTYSQAYAALSMAYSRLGIAFRPPSEMFWNARQYAIKARDLNSALPDAHVALATVAYRYDWKWSEAEKEIKTALDLDPSSVDAQVLYCNLLWTLDRPEEALSHARTAFSVDDASFTPRATLGTAYIFTRDFVSAEREYKSLLDMSGNYVFSYRAFSYIREHEGRYNEAIAELNKAMKIDAEDPTVLAALGRVLALQNKKVEALAVVQKMREISTRKHFSPIHFAEVYAELGDSDKAMVELEKAERERSAYMPLIADRLTLKALRGDPRFIALLNRLNIPT